MITSEEGAREWLLGLPDCDSKAFARLEALVAALAEENQRQNLVSKVSMDTVWQRHIADSAQLLGLARDQLLSPWLDLGTGAGFPGLVIATLRPDWQVTLVESRPLRTEWLMRMRNELELDGVSVVTSRIEHLETVPVAAISARAFAPLDRLLDLSARFSTNDTVWLLPKGRSAQHELFALQGWHHMFHVEQSLTDSDAGIVTGKLLGRKGRRS